MLDLGLQFINHSLIRWCIYSLVLLGSVASDASAIQTKSSLLTAALTRTSKKVESPKPKLRSKKNTPIKEALKNASGKNTPNKTRLAKEKETPKKSTTGSSTAEINYIDLSDDDEDFGEPIVKPEPVLQAPAASKPLAPSNLTQPKIQSTFLKSSKAETKPLTSKVTDSPKQKDVKRASGRERKWDFWYFYFYFDRLTYN